MACCLGEGEGTLGLRSRGDLAWFNVQLGQVAMGLQRVPYLVVCELESASL